MTRYLVTGLGTLLLLSSRLSMAYTLPTEPINLAKVRPPSARSVYDSTGQILDYWYGDQLRLYRSKDKIDSNLVDFVVWAEDAKFWTHSGFDIEEIKNSLKKNLEKGEIRRGGSTITQQLAKNLFLDREKSFVRKLFEIPWAIRLEKDLKKAQILELYLNTIEWGPGIYGAEAACRHYFDKTCEHLDIGQALYMAVIIPNPPRFDLFAFPGARAAIEARRKFLVHRLIEEKKVPTDQKEEYLSADFGLVAPDFSERIFPVSHKATYFGNRFKKSEWLKDLEKNMRKIAKTSEVHLSLDKAQMLELNPVPVLSAPGAKEKFLFKEVDGKIVAFIKIPAGKTVIKDDWDLEEWTESAKMPWARLLR